MKPTLLILAAGMGSRYGGLKQTDKLGPSGETIIDYSIYDAIHAGFGRVVFIIREAIREEFVEVVMRKFEDKIPCSYVMQELDKLPEGYQLPAERKKPWGTGHAVLMAAQEIKEPFAVINADDFYGRDSFEQLARFLEQQDTESHNFAMVGYRLKNTLSEFGYVSRGICESNDEMLLTTVTERTKIKREENGIQYLDEQEKPHPLKEEDIVSMNFWGFTPKYFQHLETGFKDFLDENINKEKSEYYIPTEVNNLINKGTATVKVLPTSSSWFGITFKEDKQLAMDNIKKLVGEGVYPENLWP